MKKLSKAQVAEVAQLRHDEEAAREVLNTAITGYNEVKDRVNTFVQGVAEEMESYWDEKSDKWKEGDAGEAYLTWKDTWAESELGNIDDVDPNLFEGGWDDLTEEP